MAAYSLDTGIGQPSALSRRKLRIAVAVGVFVVVADLLLAWWDRYWEVQQGRGVLAIVGLCIVLGLGAWLWLGHRPRISYEPLQLGITFLNMCVFAPVLEEVIYRLALCMPLAPFLGPWPTVILSGLVFGWLHVLYGNPSPENLIGGVFLAWAYLKSQSLLVPVLLHSAGNLMALLAQVGYGYWFTGHLSRAFITFT